MNFFKNKFFVSVLILSVTIFLLSAPTAQAEDALGTILTIVAVVVAVVIIAYCAACAPALAPVITGATTTTLATATVLTNVVAYSTVGGILSSVAFGAGGVTLIVTTTAVITTTVLVTTVLTAAGMAIIGSVLVGVVACAEGLICPGGQSSGLLLTAVSSDMGCTYQIPMTFYSWQSDVYGYPAFKYDYGEGENANTGLVNSKALFKDSNCTNSVTNPYSSDNRYAMVSPVANFATCTPIYPSNIFKYISGYNDSYDEIGFLVREPIYTGIGFSPHYRDSACANLISDPFSPEAKYANVSGVGCVNITPLGRAVLLDPYFDETNRQVVIYRFALSADSDQTLLNSWFIDTIKANVGNGWQRGNVVYNWDGTVYDNPVYHSSSESTPLITALYADLCVGNVCKFTDATVPENSYVAYVAKVLGSYSFRTAVGSSDSIYEVLTTEDNKFFNNDNLEYAAFPDATIGNAINGPYKTDPCPTPAPTASISADSASIAYNTGTTVRWSSTNATSCTASGDWSDDKALSGSEDTGNLTSSKTYTLTCDGDGGSVSKSVTVTVTIQLPGSFSLSLGGSGSASCNSVPLSWTTSSSAAAYRILRGSPRVDISPYQPYTALNYSDTTVSENTSHTYQIEAYNSAGTQRSNSINIVTPYCPPIVDIKANEFDGPISIYQGQSVTLSWSSSNSTSMMGSIMGSIMGGATKELRASVYSLLNIVSAASSGWSGSMLLNGNRVVVPSPPSATFTITGSGPGGSASDSVTVDVTPLALPDWREIVPR